jgi:DnaJ-class molecular chaperone
MDYYSILGINRGAQQEDIKKAYRKLAMQHHPDRNGGNDTRFKQIQEAYATLSDPQKRQQYDNPQPRMDSSAFGQGFNGDFTDIFNGMFNGGFRQQRNRQPSNSDVKLRVKVNFEDVLIGKSIIVSYKLRNGKIQDVNLDVPPGVNDGDTIKFRQLGDDSLPGARGDLYVTIQVNNKIGWQRSNNDLITKVYVNCLEMITGCKTVVNTLDGKQLELTIPPGTKSGTTFSVNGYGIPDVRSNVRGKLLISVEAEIPKNLTPDNIEKIREIILNATS